MFLWSRQFMKPSQLSMILRRIASGIDSSKRPSRSLVARDLKRVLAAVGRTVRIAGNHLPNGEVIPVAPSSGKYVDPATGYDVEYKLENVGHLGEKGYEDLRGSISIDGGPWITMDAEAYKSGSRYKALSSSDPNMDVQAYNDQVMNDTGVDLGGVLAGAAVDAIYQRIKAGGIVYNENEGPHMDLSIDDNEASDP